MTDPTVLTLRPGDPVLVLTPAVTRPSEGVFLGWSPMIRRVARVSVDGREVTADKSQLAARKGA